MSIDKKLARNIYEELQDNIAGDVYYDKLRRYMHSTDGSIFRVEPSCTVYPRTTEDVKAVCAFATNHNLSVHARGAGSGLCGACIGQGIVIDFTKYMNKLIDMKINPGVDGEFTCEPGYKYGQLEELINGSGLFFPPSPSSGEYATFGGMYGTNAGGAYSVKYGNVADYIVDAEFVLPDGTVATIATIEHTPTELLGDHFKSLFELLNNNKESIMEAYPKLPCNVSGYELREAAGSERLKLQKILGGSEGTLAIVTKLTFKLVRKLPYESLLVAYFDDKISSAKAAQIALKYNPTGIEIMDKSLLALASSYKKDLADKIPQGVDNVLLIEFDGETAEEVKKSAEESMRRIQTEFLSKNISIAINEEDKEQFTAVRKAAVPILYLLKGKKKILALVEDAAVPTETLVEYFEGLYEIFGRHNVNFVTYGHIAKGLLHNRPLLDMKDPQDIELLKVLADAVYELVSRLGGTISGEHGDGRLRSCYIPQQYKSIYDLFLRVKSIFDPNDMFNPDIKTVNDPYQMTKHLRYGVDYRAIDNGQKMLLWNDGLVEETEKCHGCSKCTTVTFATRMCPVYKVLKDEAAAPKAKANVLRALLSGAISSEALYSEAFQDVMDHCVNCGSCSVECPSKVNIPKLALEAKSRYAEKFGVSLQAKLVTKFEMVGRRFRKFAPIISFVMMPKFIRKLARPFTGLSPEREFIQFSTQSLSDIIDRTEGSGSKVVMYFAGCYASYVRPEIGESTVDVLLDLGFKVVTPEQHCCGIPHLSKGMADKTREQIAENIKCWGKLVDEVDYIVTSCSSCALALQKEWNYYLSGETIDKIAAKTIMATELVAPLLKDRNIARMEINLAYHQPCHMRLLPDSQSSLKALKLLPGVTVEDLKSSCCGMAGSWGLADEHYDLSVKIGTPMVEKLVASKAQIGVTECPTCMMQMEHLGDKPVLNPIEVIDRCLKMS